LRSLPLVVGGPSQRQGSDKVGAFAKTPMSKRQYCTVCGGHLMTNHPPLGMVDVHAATLPGLGRLRQRAAGVRLVA